MFSLKRAHRPSLAAALPKARVLSAPMPTTFSRWPRFEAQAKPQYPVFMREVRKALKPIAHEFDITFQIMPQAARYPIPLRSFDVPYVVGPLGGALETPEAFKGEGKSAAWFTRARVLDHLRFRHDPWLRASYAEAALVLGVAPYMEDVLGAITLKRFAPVLELGIADLPELPERAPKTTGLNLLHVGRGVRTKGLRDVIRAMGHLKDSHPDLTLMSAGTCEEIDICRAEAQALGIADRVTFKGQIAREEVETLYREADMFVFPSFREPAGNVLYEAMRWGLPVIAAARGGPDWIVDDTTGIRIPVTTPEKYAREISPAIAAGEIVISDRFADSTRIYQGTARADLRGIVDRLHDTMIGREPDLTLIIDMDPEVALARGLARRSGEDRFEDMGADFQMRLAQGFRELAAAQPGRCRLIDGTGTPEEVSDRVLAEIALRLP